MTALVLVPVLFVLFYFLPGAVLLSNTSGAKQKRFENLALATLLSQLAAPLTLTLLGRAVPSNDGLLMTGYFAFWALAVVGVRLMPRRVKELFPDFGFLPKADKGAWLVSVLLTAIVVSLRIGLLQGYISQVGDDFFHLTKLSSIATTGLPSFYARQPLLPFTYYDLDYIAPSLWIRYTDGAIGVAQAWVIHVGIQTFAISLFLTRLLYMYARTRLTRLFGLLTLHTATGFDLFFLPWLQDRSGMIYMEMWPRELGWFDGFMQISMPITLYMWVPQHLLGLAALGLIFYILVTKPFQGLSQAVAIALLLVAMFRTSIFVFVGAIPGLSLWYLIELFASKERKRYIAYVAATALIALGLVLPYVTELLGKSSYLRLELRTIEFLDIPGLAWLSFPITVPVYLLLEVGILMPILLWLLTRPHLYARSFRSEPTLYELGGQPHGQGEAELLPLRFWLCTAVGILLPLLARSAHNNDIAMRGAMPAQLAIVILGCYVLSSWERRNRRLVTALVAFQLLLSFASTGTELLHRFNPRQPKLDATTHWIANDTPFDALVFYEYYPKTEEAWVELNYGQRMSFLTPTRFDDFLYTSVPVSAWRCLPDIDLYNAGSLCSVEAHIPGKQPVFVKFASPDPSLDSAFYTPVFTSDIGSVFALSCPSHDISESTDPPRWLHEPYEVLRPLLEQIPADHAIAVNAYEFAFWMHSNDHGERLFLVTPEDDGPRDALSQTGLWMTSMNGGEGVNSVRQLRLTRRLKAVDVSSSPVWFLLDYTLDSRWNDLIYAHIQKYYYVAQPNIARSQWLDCKQRVVLALPTTVDELSVVHGEISFGEKLSVSEWRTASRAHRPGEVIPIELLWRKLEDEQLKFFVHLLDSEWTLHAQIDLPAAGSVSDNLQLTKMALYLPPDLPAGEYQIRLGVYRPEDGQRLTLPRGEDGAHIQFTVAP